MIRQARYSRVPVAGPASSREVISSDTGEYTGDELEFLRAIDRLKRHSPFPTWNEVFAVVIALGYHK